MAANYGPHDRDWSGARNPFARSNEAGHFADRIDLDSLRSDSLLEALRLARQRNRVQNRELLHYARLLRVERAMTPYLQALE